MDQFQHKGYSQNGEEGIIREIVRRLGIAKGWFVEFGAMDGVTGSNTFGLAVNGWNGLYIEGDQKYIPHLSNNIRPWPNLRMLNEYVTCEPGQTLDELLLKADIPKDLDLLSIDIDGNDYWVWKSTAVRPKIVVIEYNCHCDPGVSKTIPYDPGHRWQYDDFFGASAKALVDLGKSKGYSLVCHFFDVNLFFVRNEWAGLFDPWPLEKIPLFRRHPASGKQMIDVSP